MLYDEAFYIGLLNRWKDAYKAIQKINDVSLNFQAMKKKQQLYKMGVLSLIEQAGGQLQMIEQINEAQKRGELSKKQAFDLRQVINEVCKIRDGLTVPNEAIKELDKKAIRISIVLPIITKSLYIKLYSVTDLVTFVRFELMLDPDFNTKWKEAIYLKIEGGSFICNSIYEGETLLFDSVSGRLSNIYADYRRFRSGVFKYWHIELTDNENGNIYLICFLIQVPCFSL